MRELYFWIVYTKYYILLRKYRSNKPLSKHIKDSTLHTVFISIYCYNKYESFNNGMSAKIYQINRHNFDFKNKVQHLLFWRVKHYGIERDQNSISFLTKHINQKILISFVCINKYWRDPFTNISICIDCFLLLAWNFIWTY